MNAPQSAVIGEESLNAAFNRKGKGFDQLGNKVKSLFVFQAEPTPEKRVLIC